MTNSFTAGGGGTTSGHSDYADDTGSAVTFGASQRGLQGAFLTGAGVSGDIGGFIGSGADMEIDPAGVESAMASLLAARDELRDATDRLRVLNELVPPGAEPSSGGYTAKANSLGVSAVISTKQMADHLDKLHRAMRQQLETTRQSDEANAAGLAHQMRS